MQRKREPPSALAFLPPRPAGDWSSGGSALDPPGGGACGSLASFDIRLQPYRWLPGLPVKRNARLSADEAMHAPRLEVMHVADYWPVSAYFDREVASTANCAAVMAMILSLCVLAQPALRMRPCTLTLCRLMQCSYYAHALIMQCRCRAGPSMALPLARLRQLVGPRQPPRRGSQSGRRHSKVHPDGYSGSPLGDSRRPCVSTTLPPGCLTPHCTYM